MVASALVWAAVGVNLRVAEIPSHIPPKEVKYDNPPTVKPADDADKTPVPLPELPPKLFPVHFESSNFPGDPFQAEGKLPSQVAPADDKPRPPGRWLHSMVTVKDNILVYGGVSNSETLLNDVWVYNPSEGSWWKLETATKPVKKRPVNPQLKTSKSQGRPPFLPAPPPMNLPPGVKHLEKAKARKQGTADSEELKIIHLAPIPSEEPQQPYAQSLTDFRKNARRRRLLSRDQRVVLERHQVLLGAQSKTRKGTGGGNTGNIPHPLANTQVLSSNAKPLNEVWVYNIAERNWFQPLPTEVQPPPRWLHAAVTYQTTKMLIFGGVGNNLMLMNDVWVYNPESNKWKRSEPALDMPAPLPREGHAMVATSDKAVTMFGGISYGYKPFNDVWVFSDDTWVGFDIKDGQKKPPGRWMHSATLLRSRGVQSMVIYGGCSENFAPLDDVWVFDPSNQGKEWREVLPTSYRPPARWLHSASMIKTAVPSRDGSSVGSEGILVYGGAANNAPMDDLWVFDGTDESWAEYPAFTDRPIAREGHTMSIIGKLDFQQDSGGKKGKTRRRRLMMQQTEPSTRPTSVSGIEEAIDGTVQRKMVDPRANRVRPTSASDEWILLFGGSSERGLVASMQQPQPE